MSPSKSSLPSYRIRLDVDGGATTYWGQEAVRYVHMGAGPLNQIWFLLTPNIILSSVKGASPLLFVQSVEVGGSAVQFQLHDPTRLEVTLPEPLESGESVELMLEFFGKVPELDHGATTLPRHFTEQISQVIGSRGRRTYLDPPFFVSDQIAVLSGFYPMLAPRRNDEWQTHIARAAESNFCADVADYQVEIRVPEGISVYASGEQVSSQKTTGTLMVEFEGRGLRDFLVVASPRYRTLSKTVRSVEVQSIFLPEDEAVGRAILRYAASALSVYEDWFGPYPYRQLKILEAPLPAGRMSADTTCLVAVASAYYVDFQSPRGFALPGIIRENAELIEDGVEFNVAYAVARQWWGMVVGSDAKQNHFLDNALATYAALLYYEKTYGPDVAQAQAEAQLKAAYRVYRMFGGSDQPVNQPMSRFVNGFQYAAIVHVKGALFFDAIRRLMGDEAFSSALREYYRAHRFEHGDAADLLRMLRRAAGSQSYQILQLYTRWITWRRGDQDIGQPEYRIVVSTEIKPSQENRPSAFERLGRIIARQMTRVGKYAVRPF
ncbi:MAG: hypothetical protein HY314_03575 [Acidobacteria bacterium]|nr:hypothetical protein [Acidobacteriota bacterium]